VYNLIQSSLNDSITPEDVLRVLEQYQATESGSQLETSASNPDAAAQEKTAAEDYALPDLNLPLRQARDAFERLYFQHHLKETHNMSRLAQTAGLERTHLYRKLKQLGIKTK